MNRRNFLGLVSAIPAFSVLLPRPLRVLDKPRLKLVLLDSNARDIEHAEVIVTRDDFGLLDNGPWDWGESYVNNKNIDFPKPTYEWGSVHGVRISDMSGKQICKTKFKFPQYVRFRQKDSDAIMFAEGDFILSLPDVLRQERCI